MFKENLKIKIVPQNIETTFETVIEKIDEDFIYFNLQGNVMTQGECFDGYTFSENGIFYFSSVIEKIDDNIAKFSKKTKAELLQRRQFQRIKIDNDVQIKNTKTNDVYEGWMIDISVGGFKMHTKKEIDKLQKYRLQIELNQKILDLEFKPITFVKDMENLYTLSARFVDISNTDKITLVQYCYKKQAEKINE